MTHEKLVIIGNGMATARLLERLLKQSPGRYQISLFGEEPHASYNRIMLSPVLAGETHSDTIMLHSSDWYQQHEIRFYSGDPIVRIDREQKKVISRAGVSQHYDRLIIATGSRPALPEAVRQCELDGLCSFRNLDDVDTLRSGAARSQHALVIGGGLLGLEAAHGLRQLGCEVTVLHRSDWLLNRQLDSAAGQQLQQTLSERGINIKLGCEALSIHGDEQVERVTLSDGSELAVQLVVSAIGITPNTTLARHAGLDCQQGIVVNNQLQTSDPAIYALGECSQFNGATFGLVAPIYDQAQVLASALSDQPGEAFENRPVATRLKVSGIELFSAGLHLADDDTESQHFYNHLNGSYKKLLFKGNQLVGTVLYGDVSDGNWYFELIQQQQDITPLRPLLMFGQALATQPTSARQQDDSHALTSATDLQIS